MKTKLLTILLLFALAIPAPIRAAEQEEDPSLGEMISMLWEHRNQVGEKLAPEQMKKAKEIEELPHRKALMALCAILCAACGYLTYRIWNEADKRKKKKEMIRYMGFSVITFLLCALGVGVGYIFIPLALCFGFTYPMLYDPKKCQKMERINKITTILLILFTFFFGAWCMALAVAISFTRILFLAYILVMLPGIVVLIGGLWYYPRKMRKLRKDICPHCFGYGAHEFIKDEVLKVENELQTYSQDHFHHKEEKEDWHGNKTETHYYTRENRIQEVRYVYYDKIYQCICCGEIIRKHHQRREVLSDRSL